MDFFVFQKTELYPLVAFLFVILLLLYSIQYSFYQIDMSTVFPWFSQIGQINTITQCDVMYCSHFKYIFIIFIHFI